MQAIKLLNFVTRLYVTGFAKRGLIHTSNFSNLTLHNSAFVRHTALKFSRRTVLSLPLHDRKFQSNSLLKNEVIPLQSHTIGCVYKTPFRKSSHIYSYNTHTVAWFKMGWPILNWVGQLAIYGCMHV